MNESDDLFVAISSVCFWQPKTVCWSSSKAMLILSLCKGSNTDYSYLHAHPEIWLFFVFLIHFFKWTSPRTDFLKYRWLPDSGWRKWRQDVEAGIWKREREYFRIKLFQIQMRVALPLNVIHFEANFYFLNCWFTFLVYAAYAFIQIIFSNAKMSLYVST